MAIDYGKLGDIILRRRIVFSDVECTECGSRQCDGRTHECIGCEMQAQLGLSFNEVCDEAWAKNTNPQHYRYMSLRDAHTEKRRGNAAREQALRTGHQYYHGQMCDKCACNLRSSETGDCEACALMGMRWNNSCGEKNLISTGRSRLMIEGRWFPIITMFVDRIMRHISREIGGERVYIGAPCECGNNRRYAARGQCTSCVKERNDIWLKRARSDDKKKTAPARTGAADFDHLFE